MLSYRLFTSAALILTCVSTQVHAEVKSTIHCWRSDEAKAARIQNLQTLLMVDAIKCQDTLASTLESYNGFMAKWQDQLIANKYMVQAHFVRRLGPVDGAKAATDYDTRVGNQLSASAISVDRCETSGMFARLATNASDDDLVIMANALAKTVEVPECPVDTPAKSRPEAMVIPVWDKPAPAGVQPVGAPAPTAVSPQGSGMLTQASAPGPAKGVSVPPPATDKADTVKALQAAVAALNQVAATLQTDVPPGVRGPID